MPLPRFQPSSWLPFPARALRLLAPRRPLRRVLAWFAALVALFLFCHYPRHEDDIFRALPGRAVAAAYVNGIASEERALLKQEAVRGAIRAFGGDPDETLEDNSGTYWTLFWLTGRHSCVAVVPREGECAGLGCYLAGASYTDWKARALEALWRLKWVPGLGRLQTTARGTRYLEFPHAHELYDNGIVLGLDIVRGVLVAVLAQDPDLVLELSARLSDEDRPEPSRCFGDMSSTPPWRQISETHRIWARLDPAALQKAPLPPALSRAGDLPPLPSALRPSAPVSIAADLPSFTTPGLRFSAILSSGAAPAPGLAAPAGGAAPKRDFDPAPPPAPPGTFLSVAAHAPAPPQHLLPPAFPRLAPGYWTFRASAGASAVNLALFQIPSLSLSAPLASGAPAFESWWPAAFADLKHRTGTFGHSLRDLSLGPGVALLRSKTLEAFGQKTPRADQAFVRQDGDRMELGLGWGAATAFHPAPPDGAPPAAPLAVAHLDFNAMADEAGKLSALLRLGASFGLQTSPRELSALTSATLVLNALRGLGSADATLWNEPAAPGAFRLDFRSSPPPPSNDPAPGGDDGDGFDAGFDSDTP